jgi:hypothetical protein
MDNSWIKLFRKLLNHPVFEDEKGLRVFLWILMSVDKDSGEMKTGRFWAAARLGYNPSTYKNIIGRLSKKYQLITTTGTNKYTTIRVVNWSKYQVASVSRPPERPTKDQQKTTTQELENKYINAVNKNSFKSNRFTEIGLPQPKSGQTNEQYILSLTSEQAWILALEANQ